MPKSKLGLKHGEDEEYNQLMASARVSKVRRRIAPGEVVDLCDSD